MSDIGCDMSYVVYDNSDIGCDMSDVGYDNVMLSKFSDLERNSIEQKRENYALHVITLLYPWGVFNPLPVEGFDSWWELYLYLVNQELFSSFALEIMENIQSFYDNMLEELNTEELIIFISLFLEFSRINPVLGICE